MVSTRQEPGAGESFEAGVWLARSRGFGAAIVLAHEKRDTPGSFVAQIPHPLYLDRPRLSEGALPGGIRRETSIHVGLVWSRPVGGVLVRLAAGPSYVVADVDLADRVVYDHAYPYDDVQVTAVPTSMVRGDGIGGHAALSLEFRLSSRAALAAGGRWSRATLRLESGSGEARARAETCTAGGVTAGLGLRLYF